MNKKHIYLILISLFCGTFVVQGQGGLESTVNVTKEFEGRLGNAQKSMFNTGYSDTLLKLNLNFDYSAFDRPYKDLYEFSPVDGVKLNMKGEAVYPWFYFKGALAYPLMPEADLYIQPRLGEKHSLSVYGNHYSFWGNRGVEKGPVNRSKSKGGLSYGYNWSKGEARVSGFYRYDYHLFNKSQNYNHGAQNTQFMGGNVLLRSLNPDRNTFYYNLDADYVFTNCQHSSVEHMVDADLDLGFKIGSSQRVNLGIDFFNSKYYTVFNSGNATQIGLIELIPQYSYSGKRFNLLAGVSIGGVYSKGGTDNGLKLYPKLNLTYEAVKDNLWLRLKVDGENKLYSVYELLNLNPWLDVDVLKNYHIPLRAMLGLSGAVSDIFGYNLDGGYVRHNQYLSFYGTNDLQRISTAEGVNEFNASLDLMVKTKPVEVKVKGDYRYLGDANVYMVPKFSVGGEVKYNYMGRIYAELAAKCYGAMSGKGVSYSPFVDLGAKVTYVHNSKFSFFVQGRNLLNNKIFYIQDYVEPGLNFALGLFIKL